MIQYLLLTNGIILFVLGIWTGLLSIKLRSYMQKRYPEKAEQFFYFFTGNIRLYKWVHEQDDTGDLEIIRLKAKTKIVFDSGALIAIFTPLLWLLYFICI